MPIFFSRSILKQLFNNNDEIQILQEFHENSEKIYSYFVNVIYYEEVNDYYVMKICKVSCWFI